jgi:hypothetical protein
MILLLLKYKIYKNKSVYKLPPGTTAYSLRSFIPASASTSSSIKVLPVHSVEGLPPLAQVCRAD